VQIEYPEIEDPRTPPRHRFMSSYEQKIEAWCAPRARARRAWAVSAASLPRAAVCRCASVR
jgi:hypothetical protein